MLAPSEFIGMADQMVLLFNNITALKTKCVSFYQSFEPAGRIMDALAQQVRE